MILSQLTYMTIVQNKDLCHDPKKKLKEQEELINALDMYNENFENAGHFQNQKELEEASPSINGSSIDRRLS